MENREHFGQHADRMQAFRVEVLDKEGNDWHKGL